MGNGLKTTELYILKGELCYVNFIPLKLSAKKKKKEKKNKCFQVRIGWHDL